MTYRGSSLKNRCDLKNVKILYFNYLLCDSRSHTVNNLACDEQVNVPRVEDKTPPIFQVNFISSTTVSTGVVKGRFYQLADVAAIYDKDLLMGSKLIKLLFIIAFFYDHCQSDQETQVNKSPLFFFKIKY